MDWGSQSPRRGVRCVAVRRLLKGHARRGAIFVLIAVCLAAGTLSVDAQPAPTQPAVPNSDVAVCSAAVPARFARCFARVRTDAKVVGATPARQGVRSASAIGNGGAYDPAYLQSAYNLAGIASSAGATRTVAIVDAFDAPPRRVTWPRIAAIGGCHPAPAPPDVSGS